MNYSPAINKKQHILLVMVEDMVKFLILVITRYKYFFLVTLSVGLWYHGSEEEDEGIDSYRKGGYHAVRVGDPFNGNRYIAPRKLGWSQFSMTEQQPTTKRQQFMCLIVMYAVVLCLFHLWKMNEIPSSSSPTTRFNNNNSK
ncbi:hypothetical protein ACFE04_008660 [Oxalis oulophora]